MPGQFGDTVAQSASQAPLTMVTGSWRALSVGSIPLTGRRQVKVFIRGNPGHALGIAFSQRGANNTYATPTDSIRNVTVYPGNSIFVEPLGDGVAIFGQLLGKVGVTDSSIKVIVTEYK